MLIDHRFRLPKFLRRQADCNRHRLRAGENKPNKAHHPAVSIIMKEQTNTHTQTIINKTWNTAKGTFDYSFVFAFHSKEQYLTFRRLWKENYAALSGAIRSHKAEVKVTLRKCEYAGVLQGNTHNLKREATTQLLMLQAAKQEANRQFLATRQTAQ
jgi:hypothetical protein